MAKLDRPFRVAGTPALQGQSMQAASQDNRALQSSLGNLSRVADQASAYFAEIENNKASTEMSLEFSEQMSAVEQAGDYITADQAREFGYDGPLLLEEDLSDREEIAMWEVLPEIAKQNYDKLTDKYGSKLSGQQNKQEWVNRRRIQSQEYYANLKQFQVQKQFEKSVEDHGRAIQRAVQLGDFGLAAELAMTHPDVDAREEAMDAVNYESAVAETHDAYQSENIPRMQQQVEVLRDREYSGVLSEVERTAHINMLNAKMSQMANANIAKRLEPFENMRRQYEVAKAMEDPTAAAHLAEMHHYLDQVGMQDYAAKGFFAKEEAALAKIFSQQDDFAFIGPAWQTGDSRPIDQSDPNQQKYIDNMVEKQMQQAAATGDPVVIAMTAQQNLKSGIDVGYIPNMYTQIIQDSALTSVDMNQVSLGAELYGMIANENPRLAGELPENVRVMAQAIYDAGQAGITDADSIKEIRSSLATLTEKDLEKIDSSFNKLANSEKNTLDHWLRSAASTQWMGFIGDEAEISPVMVGKFKDLVHHHMRLNGGRDSQAMTTAFQDWSNTYQPTRVNGRLQYGRSSIEQKFGVETEAVQADLNTYMGSALEDYQSTDKFEIYPDMITPTTDVPSYAVFKVDENDMPTLVMDDNGAILRYTPDIARIKKTAKHQELVAAERKRMINQNPELAIPDAIAGMGGTYKNPPLKKPKDEDDREAKGRMTIVGERSNQIAADRKLLSDLDGQ